MISLDGSSAESIASNASKTFDGVSTGSHSVTLRDVATNCTVPDGDSKNISVTAGEATDVIFTVACAAIETSSLAR
jgi:hypothetical protein